MKQLRPYQIDAINATVESINNGMFHNIIALPTGTGKSLVIAEFIRLLTEWYDNPQVLVLTHRKELIEQNVATLKERINRPIGILNAGLGLYNYFAITFASIQSIYNRDLKRADYVFIDECHLVNKNGKMYKKVLDTLLQLNPKVKIVGLTATPWRTKDGSLLNDTLWDNISYNGIGRFQFLNFIKEGYLCNLITLKPDDKIDVTGVSIGTDGDYRLNELNAAVNKQNLTNTIIGNVISYVHTKGIKKLLVFACGLEHANEIKNCFNSYGIYSQVIDGALDQNLRALYIKEFKAGKLKALINFNVLTTGFDVPDIDCIVCMRPTKSSNLWVQMVGRGSRPFENKTHCLVLDYTDNIMELGPINDPVIPEPKGSKRKTKAPTPQKVCPKCKTVWGANKKKCDCGYEFPIERKLKINANSTDKDIVSTAKYDIQQLNVHDFTLKKYTTRKGNECILIEIDCISVVVKVYIEPRGTQYQQLLARRMWMQLFDTAYSSNIDVWINNYLEGMINTPTQIKVWLDTPNKYPQVLEYFFDKNKPMEVPF